MTKMLLALRHGGRSQCQAPPICRRVLRSERCCAMSFRDRVDKSHDGLGLVDRTSLRDKRAHRLRVRERHEIVELDGFFAGHTNKFRP